MRFEGKTALVTGGAKGIGAATATLLAREGATVVVADFDEAAAQETATSIGGHAVRCDVTKREDVEAAVEAAVSHGGSLDILVTCAGIIRDNMLFKMSDEDWDAVIDTHLKGTFYAVARSAEAHGRAEAREDGADLLDLRARQPRPDELLDRQGGPAGDDEDACDRARPVQRQRQLRRAGLHRDGDDAADRRAHGRAVRAVHGGGLGAGAAAPRRPAGGRRGHDRASSARKTRATSAARSSTSPAARATSDASTRDVPRM